MQSKLEKVVAGLKTGPRFLKELREFDTLIKAIGECKSKAEEDRIILQELEVLKQRLSDPKLDKSRGKEYMIRLIYCEMLGHDASFAYVKALQFASDPNIHTKKAAYLALTQFLDYNNQLVLLLVNTLLSDMKSDNYLIVCTALVTTTKLIGPDLINAVYPVVVERLRHPKEHVRKKAVMALHWFGTLDPRREGPLMGVELDRHFRTMLCDKDPAVMSAALCALYECIKADPRPYKNLIPSFTSILKQVAEHRLPKTYDYHRFPAPFIQIKLLKILAALGAGDRASSENMYAVLGQTLRRANTSHTIGSALIYECVRTITTIYPNPQLLAAAAESIAAFLRSPSHNLRYVGIDALAGITALNPAAAAEHQVAVLDCLEDPDDTLKLKTLELLYKMTRSNNIQVIVDKMMGYLATCADDHIRRDIVRKVSDMAERYAPSPAWFVSTISEVFRLGGEHVDEGVAHGLMRLIAEQDSALHGSAVEAYLGLLDAEAAREARRRAQEAAGSGKRLPETILLVICWVLGEYGHLARRPPAAVLSRLLSVVGPSARKAAGEPLRAALLSSLAKLAAHTGGAGGAVGAALLAPHASSEAAALVHACAASRSLELQQRAHELTALLSLPPPLLAAALPVDAACEEFSAADLAEVAALPFLEGRVQAALAAGAAPYLPPEARAGGAAESRSKSLRFEAYEPAPFAVPVASGSSYSAAAAGSAAEPRAAASSGASFSGAAAPAVSAGPQLLAKASGPRKWGPAQYEGADPSGGGPSTSGHSGTFASGPPAAASVPHAGRHSRNASGGQPSDRDRLAASLFGGGGAPAAPAPALTARAPPATAAQRQGNGAAAVAASRPAPQHDAMSLLLDLDVPTSAPAPPPAGPSVAARGAQPQQQGQPPGDWMDSLLGSGPANVPVGSGMSAGPVAGMGMGAAAGPMGGAPPSGFMAGPYGMPVQAAPSPLQYGYPPMGTPGMAPTGGVQTPFPGMPHPPQQPQQPWQMPVQQQPRQLGSSVLGQAPVAPMSGIPHTAVAKKPPPAADPFGDLLG